MIETIDVKDGENENQSMAKWMDDKLLTVDPVIKDLDKSG